MAKSRISVAFAHAFMVVFLVALPLLAVRMNAATCTGADPCKACKNCKYCKHCAKDGGKCGICK